MCGAMSTGFFPGQAAFSGPVVGLGAAPETSFAGQAHFSGCLVATTWPRANAERLLPPELELAPNTSGTPAIHPVLFSFGDQLQGSFLLGGVPIEAGPTYREFCVIVPFVRRRGGGRSLHLYSPRLYSTSYPAYWHGNMSYGLRKAMAGMGWEGSTFVVTSPDGDALAHADVERTADWRPPADTDLPGFDALRAAYLEGVAWEPADVLEARAAALLPALFLARVDGKSPVEYLTAADQDRVRRFARPLIEASPERLETIPRTWAKELENA